jgi:aspartate/glutamate racemase
MKSHLYISPLNNLGIKIIIPEKEKHDSISQTIHKDVKLLEKYSNELVES